MMMLPQCYYFPLPVRSQHRFSARERDRERETCYREKMLFPHHCTVSLQCLAFIIFEPTNENETGKLGDSRLFWSYIVVEINVTGN